MTKMNQAERQQLILNTLLATIKPENTGWREIVKAIEALNVVKPGGWLEVSDLLQYPLDQGRSLALSSIRMPMTSITLQLPRLPLSPRKLRNKHLL